MRRLILIVSVCALLCAGGVAGADTPHAVPAKKIDKKASLSIIQSGVFNQLDPAREANTAELPVPFAIYDRLFYIDHNIELQPMLAQKWTFSADGLQMTVNLRTDAVFHDGSKVDATAVKMSIERAKTLPRSTAVAGLAPITAVDVVDASTVRFTFSRPGGDMPWLLARNAGAIINPKAITAGTDLSLGDSNMAGSGPWVVQTFQPGVSVVLTRASTKYWDKKAGRIKTVTITSSADPNTLLNTLNSGGADGGLISTSIVDAAKNIAGHKLHRYVTPGVYALMFHDTRPNVSNVTLRKAIATAIDEDAIGNQLLGGKCAPAHQSFPADAFGGSPSIKDPYPHDVNKAKQLVAQSGISNPTFTIQNSAGLSPQTEIVTAIVDQLKQVGITANVDTAASNQAFSNFVSGSVDSYLQVDAYQGFPTLWWIRYITPSGTFYKIASGAPGQQLEDLVKQATDPSLKPAQLQATWDKMNQLMADNVWMVPICYDVRYWSFPKNVKGGGTMSWVWAVGFDIRYLSRTKAAK